MNTVPSPLTTDDIFQLPTVAAVPVGSAKYKLLKAYEQSIVPLLSIIMGTYGNSEIKDTASMLYLATAKCLTQLDAKHYRLAIIAISAAHYYSPKSVTALYLNIQMTLIMLTRCPDPHVVAIDDYKPDVVDREISDTDIQNLREVNPALAEQFSKYKQPITVNV